MVSSMGLFLICTGQHLDRVVEDCKAASHHEQPAGPMLSAGGRNHPILRLLS